MESRSVDMANQNADLPNVAACVPAESAGQRDEVREAPIPPWKYLVRREHSWRQQLYIKGRNMTARQLVGGIRANQLNEAQAASNYQLPAEAVHEALAYVAE